MIITMQGIHHFFPPTPFPDVTKPVPPDLALYFSHIFKELHDE